MMRGLLVLVALLAICAQSKGQTTTEQPSELPPGWWPVPKTSTRMKIGGYVKFDLIHDFNPINSPDYFDVSKIPTDGSEGESTHLHAKETRLFIDTRSPSKWGEVRVYVEGDFYGTSGAFRLRHAIVDINDKIMAGQFWSNFMDETIIPATLDFEKPVAYVFARHGIFRWKQKFSDHSYLALALEEPNANGQAPAEPGKFESPLPDLTARYRMAKEWGHVQLSAFAASIRYRYESGDKDDVGLFGVNLSGQFILPNKDYFIYQGVYGPGVGRFRSGPSATLDANGDLEALTDAGFTLGYLHNWTSSLTSLFVYNHGTNDNTAGQPASALHHTNYFAANLLYHFSPVGFFGVEYLRGYREDFNENDGTANRIQISVKYAIN